MMKRFLGGGVVVLVAFAAACTSEAESTEAVGSNSEALITSLCAGDSVRAMVNDQCGSSNPTVTITADNVKTNEIRAQAFFSYIMGGPPVPHYVTISNKTYDLWGRFWSTGVGGAESVSEMLSIIRGRVVAGVPVTKLASDTMCSMTISKYAIQDTVAGLYAADIHEYMNADLNWCSFGSSAPVPSFFFLGYDQVGYEQGTVYMDPEPVTLNAGQTMPATGTYSSSTNAAATGSNTGAAYSQVSPNTQGGGVFRWPSAETYAASTTQLAIQVGAKGMGVPCYTTDQTGTGTDKYIQKGMLANKYLCK